MCGFKQQKTERYYVYVKYCSIVITRVRISMQMNGFYSLIKNIINLISFQIS